jgi:uncharacterized protein (TIGR02145 family)
MKRNLLLLVTLIATALSVSKAQELATIPSQSDDGVTINGVTWATRNVGEKGQFVNNPEDYGNYYTFDEAKTACPTGWRVPTAQEFELLASTKSKWTKQNGVTGRRFGSGTNTIFLPAASWRYNSNKVLDADDSGEYWSSTAYNDISGYHLSLLRLTAILSFNFNRANGFSVRCVKDSARDTESNISSSAYGVEMNGITWATRNVGEKGQFVDNPEDYGLLYDFYEAQTACPAGWRPPTKKEIKVLNESVSEWTTLNGVAGRRFSSGNQAIFLPVAGYRFYFDDPDPVISAGTEGSYWSSTERNDWWYHLYVGSLSTLPSYTSYAHGLSVRCVRK